MTTIDDLRMPAAFKGTTFSLFKKTEVRKQLLQNMLRGKIEPACYWAAELICAGQFLDLWENIFHFMAKHIHLGNVKLPIYLEKRYRIFNNIVDQKLFANEIELRNKPEIRRLFAEVVCILTVSSRKPSFESVKIMRKEEFDMTLIGDKLKADRADYAMELFQEKDPRELVIPINEFVYEIQVRRNMATAWYWIEWIIDFDVLCKSQKRKTRIVNRDYPVDAKYRGDLIWLIWDAIQHLQRSQFPGDSFLQSVIQSLLYLFCCRYTSGSSKKRRYLLYMAVEVLTEPMDKSVEIITETHKPTLSNVVEQIDQVVYKQIKKSEQGSGMDYLFDGLGRGDSLQRTIQRLSMMGDGF